jgi:hypothetical protein
MRKAGKEGKPMKMPKIRDRAKGLGINAFGKTKEALIREVQRAENNHDCYNRGESATCGQTACAWRDDCK